MILEGITATVFTPDRLQPDSFIPWQEMLHFPIEAQAVLTPFREQILSYIYRTALGLSEGRLESAIVEPVSEPDEEDSLHLHLALTINMDWDKLDELLDHVLAKVAEWSLDWTEAEREDYGRWIFFSLTPSHI